VVGVRHDESQRGEQVREGQHETDAHLTPACASILGYLIFHYDDPAVGAHGEDLAVAGQTQAAVEPVWRENAGKSI
jgi:hypothetical protein